MLGTSRFAFPLLISTICVFGAGSATGQDYPTKPIRIIVPQPPGTPVDTVARIMIPEMSKFLGQPIVVENKTGAAQMIAYEYVAKQVPADGYTIASVSVQGLAILRATVKDLRFDPLKDLPPFIGLAQARFIFGSSSKLPWKTFNELVAHAKANPGKLNYGSTGPLVRLLTETLIQDLGVNVIHVPYSSAGTYFQGIVAAEVQMAFVSDSAVVSLGEKFQPLAVTGKGRRAPFLAVPTFAELGYPQIPGVSYSFNVPAGIPKAAFDKLYAAGSRALQQQEVKDLFAKVQLEIVELTPEVAARGLAEEGKLYSAIAKKVGYRPE